MRPPAGYLLSVLIDNQQHGASLAEADVERFVSFKDARPAWTALAQSTANIFSTWEWADSWWRHFGGDESPQLAAVKHGGKVSVLLPMHEQRLRGIRVLRFLGHGPADQLGPVCDPRALGTATLALRELLAGGGVLLAERLASDRDWARELGGSLIREEASPVIDLAAERDWESYLGARSANFRQQVRRRARKLQSAEGVSFSLTEDPGQLQADLGVVIALNKARWGDASTAFPGAREAFHREFAARALERGWLRLWIASAGGAPVAAWYGFRFSGVESFYQSGRDPDWDRSRVGAGLLEHTIREAFADGMREYRLLRGDEPYKRRYATRDANVCTVAAARRPVGRGTVAALSLLLRSRRVRRLLGRSDEL
jgi:CelD/BcsL family acetyltransferase involved in cellulose biosynthesis